MAKKGSVSTKLICAHCGTDMADTGICEHRDTREYENYRLSEHMGGKHDGTFFITETNTGDSDCFDVTCSKCLQSITKEQSELFYDMT